GRITAPENVGEGGRHGRTFDVRGDLGGLHRFPFECFHVRRDGLRNGVPCHIVQGITELPHVRVCGQVVFRCDDFVDEFLRHLLARLVVYREQVEELFFRRPVFHDLRGQFDEVLINGRSRQRCVFAFGEKSVQAVPEFVEERFEFVERKQRRGGGGRLGEIAAQGDD